MNASQCSPAAAPTQHLPTARELTLARDGRWHGPYGTAACPVCQAERRKGQNALTLADGRDGRLLVHCKKSGCDFRNILAALGLRDGVWRRPDPALAAALERQRRDSDRRRAQAALAIWNKAVHVAGTDAATYLSGRGIACTLPAALRFDPACWHGGARMYLPAMIARVAGSASFAVHRTYLAEGGAGKAAVTRAKAMLGPCTSGAVRLTQGPGPLLVGEGIESTLSAFLLLGDQTRPPGRRFQQAGCAVCACPV